MKTNRVYIQGDARFEYHEPKNGMTRIYINRNCGKYTAYDSNRNRITVLGIDEYKAISSWLRDHCQDDIEETWIEGNVMDCCQPYIDFKSTDDAMKFKLVWG